MERLSELNALLNMDEKGNETILADEDIGREESSTDSRDAVKKKNFREQRTKSISHLFWNC